MVLIGITLAVSLVLNIFLVWYLKKVLEKLLFISDNIGGLFDSVDLYQGHIQSVFELETYYGDETLQALIDHTKELNEELKEFEHVYSLTDEDAEEEEEEHDDNEEEAT